MSKIQVRVPKHQVSGSNEIKENIEEYIGYWRSNPHRFITEYIGGELYDFQQFVLYTMDKGNYFAYAASRGLAKTTVGVWFAIERAILYPKQKIVITAFEKDQSINFILRIQEFAQMYPNLANEIEDISTGKNNAYVLFKSKSTIKVKTLSEGARSERCEILIADEFALFKNKEILSSVFTPMMSNTRHPLYKDLSPEERKKYHEPNKEIYLSSIREENAWSWQYFLQVTDFMTNGDLKYFAIALPYHYGVKNGYITPENVAKQFRENPTNPALIRAEYEAIPLRSDSGAFFKYESFDKVRTSYDVLIAMTDEEYVEYANKRDKWKYYKEKKSTEIRVMSLDVALIGGDGNDNTAIFVFRLFPTEKGYKKVLCYIETMNGRHSKEQALRIKQLFYEMECDYFISDAAGNSVAVVEQLMDYTEDSNRGIIYDPWAIANPDEVKMNKLNSSVAVPIMYGIKTSSADNHSIYLNARNVLENEDIELPVTDVEAIEAFNTRFQYYKIKDTELKRRLLNTFVQTNLLVFETTNLTTMTIGAYIKLEPRGTKRKDRFTSWVYGLYLIKRLEQEYLASQQNGQFSLCDYVLAI